MPLQAPEVLLGLQESAGRPAQRHLGIPIAAYAMRHPTHGIVRVLDQVRRHQTAHQLGRQLNRIWSA